MSKQFGIMLPYRIAKTNEEYANDIRALVRYLRNIGIKVIDLKETDILNENKKPVEHVYILECFGNPGDISSIFSNSTVGYYGETILYS